MAKSNSFASGATPCSRRAFMIGVQGAAALGAWSPAAAAALTAPITLLSRERDIHAAFEKWSRSGGQLVIDRDVVLNRPVTCVLQRNLSYSLTTEGRREIRYAGPRYHWAICLLSQGRATLTIAGALQIDGANLVCMPFFARFEGVSGSDRRDCTVSGLTCKNARMSRGRSTIDGAPTNAYGASGMLFAGGFDHLRLRDIHVLHVTREAGAGRPGSQGCVGIGVTANLASTSSARHVVIEDFTVENVDSEDGWDSRLRGDMDGVLVFQSAERGGSAPLIRRGTIREAAGRAVKMYAPGGGGTTRQLRIFRSLPGSPGFGSVDIAHQHGDGVVSDIVITYAGEAHRHPTTAIGMSSGQARPPEFPFSVGEIRNVKIRDDTGRQKRALLSLYYNVPGPSAPTRYVINSLIDEGSARYLFLPGALGTHRPALVDLANIEASIGAGLFASEDRAELLLVRMRDVRLRGGREIPAKVLYNDRPVPERLRARIEIIADVTGLDLNR